MDATPFRIQKFSFDSQTQTVITQPLGPSIRKAQTKQGIPGYLVTSTAPPNIESASEFDPMDIEQAQRGINAIAADLYHRFQDLPTAPEIVITIHGYNTSETMVQSWYKDIFRFINQTDPSLQRNRNAIFIGYRWSSETLSLSPKTLWQTFYTLPPAPKTLFTLGNILAFAWLYGSWMKTGGAWLGLAFSSALGVTAGVTGLVAALMILRLSVYFRDVYRASNFGVLDLVELLRQIDKALIDTTALKLQRYNLQTQKVFDVARQDWETSHKKVKLSFIGHSMGALVVTNVVRILSDVFDTRSVTKKPSSDIGHTLSLERLILVGPDIPVLSIISSRANFLASSLRRFNEAYLFSNEGDLALRLASTAVNYISFPSKTQTRGYRLGNVALTHHKNYGIANLQSLRRYFHPRTPLVDAMSQDPGNILQNLYVTHSWGPGDGYLSLAELFSQQAKPQRQSKDTESRETHPSGTLADLFTFFDCTDYRDTCICFAGQKRYSRKRGILSRAKHKPTLNYWDYLELIVDSIFGRRDVHGGYFQGTFSRQLIYRLAFSGFDGVLKSYHPPTLIAPFNPQKALEALHEQCFKLGIQTYLSPLRYRVNVQGQLIQEAKADLMKTLHRSS